MVIIFNLIIIKTSFAVLLKLNYEFKFYKSGKKGLIRGFLQKPDFQLVTLKI